MGHDGRQPVENAPIAVKNPSDDRQQLEKLLTGKGFDCRMACGKQVCSAYSTALEVRFS
jgi:hypothetical protein